MSAQIIELQKYRRAKIHSPVFDPTIGLTVFLVLALASLIAWDIWTRR